MRQMGSAEGRVALLSQQGCDQLLRRRGALLLEQSDAWTVARPVRVEPEVAHWVEHIEHARRWSCARAR
jgi:hypothetical protein